MNVVLLIVEKGVFYFSVLVGWVYVLDMVYLFGLVEDDWLLVEDEIEVKICEILNY